MTRITWPPVLDRAAEIIRAAEVNPGSRDVYYVLVAEGAIPAGHRRYTYLCEAMAKRLREDPDFPEYADETRHIERLPSWRSLNDAVMRRVRAFHLERTEGQEWSIYLGVEKRGLTPYLNSWFGHLGLPIVGVGGYSSQPFVERVKRDVTRWQANIAEETDDTIYYRPSALIYAGDFDPSGVDIDRDARAALAAVSARVGLFDKVVRAAFNLDQVAELRLPANPTPSNVKNDDPRAARFVERFGAQILATPYLVEHPTLDLDRRFPVVQFEVNALFATRPDTIRDAYQTEIDRLWDRRQYERMVLRESRERGWALRTAGGAR